MKSSLKVSGEKNWFWILLLVAVCIVLFRDLLFTDKIIRASDVISQYFWGARTFKEQAPLDFIRTLPGIFQANWDPLSDGGRTLEGGWNANRLLFHEYVILHNFPFPASIAWLAVLSLIWGGIGTYWYCRLIGVGRFGAFAAGFLFAFCVENASLINAGHIQKIETISWFPWVLFFLEKALRGGRFFHYAMTALMLAVQFFNMHWQISFYSCLAVGLYWFFHVGARRLAEGKAYGTKPLGREVLFAAVMVLLFFTTISMSFAPLFSWSRQSERAGGMSYEEGMSWSMPPEEVLTFFVPGLVGYSRQEAGDPPGEGHVYYWGRMHFTQTNDYLGLLPWFLLPLPLMFRRDRYTWFFTFLAATALVMALGKYTFIYRFMFEHLPGFATFRVPKMILFLFAFAMAVLMGRGIDLLEVLAADRRKTRGWLAGLAAGVALLGLLWLWLSQSGNTVLSLASGVIDQATRYQSDPSLIAERYAFMTRETAIAVGIASCYLAAFFAWSRKWLSTKVLMVLLVLLLGGELARVNGKLLVVTAAPSADKKQAETDVVDFLQKNVGHYRIQPINEQNPHYYADYGLANISAYVTISEKLYREFLENFSLMGAMPDMMNLKYLVMPLAEFQAQQPVLSAKYTPVFTSSTGSVVLENKTVLPKAWLVHAVQVAPDPRQRLMFMKSPYFSPRELALVENPPPFQLPQADGGGPSVPVDVTTYEPNRIVVKTFPQRPALLVLGEKYYRWWYAYVDGKRVEIEPVNHILRGVYLSPGDHTVEFRFDPLPFKVGKYLTLASFAFFAVMLVREWLLRRRSSAV